MSQVEKATPTESIAQERGDDSSSVSMEDVVEKQEYFEASAAPLTKKRKTPNAEATPATAADSPTPDPTIERPAAPAHESVSEKRRDSVQSSRLSDTSNLDNVNLDDDLGAPQKQEPRPQRSFQNSLTKQHHQRPPFDALVPICGIHVEKPYPVTASSVVFDISIYRAPPLAQAHEPLFLALP
ncbi:unnamed protein product [Parascedosporium putredinis]|uniref:Uncharacterized protein n=1 Tax=Parascedosporium putredinis TaxID=1442378 RepID=A0A9P1H8Y7_9PEZI|nr:unnamed protein product [Parascedosporium putredinis]CAI8000303.1 unnamed protein product [Parascedosporium putredinis]